MLADDKERNYLNQLPTSFALPADAVDRLRAAAKRVILASPDFQDMVKKSQLHVVATSPQVSAVP